MKNDLQSVQRVYQLLIDFFVNKSFQILGAILILAVGYFIATWVSRLIIKLCERKNIDITLRQFIGSIAKIAILFTFVIIALSTCGIEVTPFVAAIGALTFGISLAIQGPVSNFGAGVSIILTRPFIVGNTITVSDVSGVVTEVRLAATVLKTGDGELITIPNKAIVGEILHNSFEYKIVEMIVGIDYAADPEKAITLIQTSLEQTPDVTSNPAPQVGIQQFGESSIDIGVRYWVPTVGYFKTQYKANLNIYHALKAGDINIPFPRRDITIRERSG